MNKKNKIFIYFLLILSLPMLVLLSSNDKVYARAEASNVVAKKAVLQGVSYCYTQGAINDTVPSLLGFYSFAELIKNSSPYNNGNFVALPSGLTLTNDNDVDCNSLFVGYGGSSGSNRFQGAFSLFGKRYQAFSTADDNSEKKTFLEGMGYTKQDTSGSCIAFEYTNEFFSTNSGKMVSTKAYTDNVCLEEGAFTKQDYGPNANNTIKSRVPITFELSSDKKTITKLKTDHGSVGDGSKKDKGKVEVSVNINASDTSPSASCSGDPAWICKLRQEVSANFSFLLKTRDPLGGFYSYTHTYVNGEGESYYKIPENRSGNKFVIAANKAIKYMSGGTYDNRESLKFSDAEKLSYYIQVVREWFYDGEEDKDSYWLCDTNGIDWNDYYNFNKEVKRTPSGELGSCRIALGEAKSGIGDANGFNGDYFDASGGTKLGLSAVIDEINRLSDEVGDDPIPDVTPGSGNTTGSPCLDSQIADDLGWILCPVLELAQKAVTDVYSKFVEPALQIKPTLFSEGGDISQSSTRDAWSIFQNFANIGFVIFFLFVIFSQVTGVGIDNYGIKKILPKMVIAAILINLSYLICVVCVDISNIIGNGLQDMFTSLEVNIQGKTAYGVSADSIGSTIMTAVPIAAGIVAAWYLITPAILLGLLVSVIGLVISLFFLFVLLAGRQAAIVILTVISPLAFLCYVLPNTKKLFDKWVKIGEGLLLVYPIAGLLMGGGNFVSRLLVSVGGSDGDFFTAFAAMMVSIVPIFFIPKVLQGSFAALGSLGATISGFGNRVRSRTTSGIRKSDAYKGARERFNEGTTRRRAAIGEDGKPIDLSDKSALWRFGHRIGTNRSIARNRAQYNKDQGARDNEALLLDPNYMENMAAHREASLSNEREKMYSEVFDRQDRGDVESELVSALSGTDVERASAALSTLVKKGGISEALGALNGAKWGAMSGAMRSRLAQTMGGSGIDIMQAFAKYTQTGGRASFQEWSTGTGATINGEKANGSIKAKTYAQHLMEQKQHAIDKYGKDEMQFVNGLRGNLRAQMGRDKYGAMMGSAIINSSDARAQAVLDSMATDDIGHGHLRASDYDFTANGLSTMREDSAKAIGQGYLNAGMTLVDLRSDVQPQINTIRSDSRMMGNMSQVSKGIFNI